MRLTMLRTPKYPGPAGEAWVLRERVQRKKEDGSSVPEFVDLGMLRCRYALLPHEGGALKKSDETENHLVAYKSEEFNNPVIVQSHGDSNTSLDASNSFLTDGSWLMKVYSPNVQVTSLKEKQWVESKNKILRVVEKCGVDTPNCQIALHPKIAEKVGGVKIVDLLERDLAGGNSAIEWDSKKGVITCNLGKFEILSLELEMK